MGLFDNLSFNGMIGKGLNYIASSALEGIR